jgi:hypothetical protein
LDGSVLFALLTHQLKATDCNGLDGSEHPLKVAARVRIPYGLPRSRRLDTIFGAVVIAKRLCLLLNPCAGPAHSGHVGSGWWVTLSGLAPVAGRHWLR